MSIYIDKINSLPMTDAANFYVRLRMSLRKFTWPTRQEVIRLTLVVITVSLIVGLFLGVLDFSFTKLLGIFIK